MTERTCYTCRWATIVYGQPQHCDQSDVVAEFRAKYPAHTNPALGGRPESPQPAWCAVVRGAGYVCGPSGALWAEREPWFVWMPRSLGQLFRKARGV